MASGGARNRSGPQPDPNSINSANKGLSFIALPAKGYDGEPPAFPLPDATPRELEVWREAWRTPQAAAWAMESWRWRTVSLWVRLTVRCEDPEAGAALLTNLHRFSDQIGMTPAGMRENAWQISKVDVTPEGTPKRTSAGKARGHLRVVANE